MQKVNYRFTINNQGVLGTALLAIGYVPGATANGFVANINEVAHFTSLSQCIAKAMAFNRRFQSAGVDTRIEVYGQVFDDTTGGRPAAPTSPVRALTMLESAEQIYARIDTPDQGLTQRLSLANRNANANAGTVLNPDFTEDTTDGVN